MVEKASNLTFLLHLGIPISLPEYFPNQSYITVSKDLSISVRPGAEAYPLIHNTPKEFENGYFTLKTDVSLQMFSVRTTREI